jgi:hypothetical protein
MPLTSAATLNETLRRALPSPEAQQVPVAAFNSSILAGAYDVSRTRTDPLAQLVLKLHSRCDLACDHCYV